MVLRKNATNSGYMGFYTKARVPSYVSGMRCVFAQTHKSERDSSIIASLSLSWFCAKTQRIPDTWDGTLTPSDLMHSAHRNAFCNHGPSPNRHVAVTLGWRPMTGTVFSKCVIIITYENIILSFSKNLS